MKHHNSFECFGQTFKNNCYVSTVYFLFCFQGAHYFPVHPKSMQYLNTAKKAKKIIENEGCVIHCILSKKKNRHIQNNRLE